MFGIFKKKRKVENLRPSDVAPAAPLGRRFRPEVQAQTPTRPYDPYQDLSNPLNPLSPLNPANSMTDTSANDTTTPQQQFESRDDIGGGDFDKGDLSDSSSGYDSSSSSDSSSYDSGSSSSDTGSSYDSSSSSDTGSSYDSGSSDSGSSGGGDF
jgi:hypothetical protein